MSKIFNCPSCHAPLDYNPTDDIVTKCSFCGNSIIVPEELREKRGARPAGTFTASNIPNADKIREIAYLAQSGKKIEAIKLYRQLFGTDLAESKAIVEQLTAGQGIALPATATVVTYQASSGRSVGCYLLAIFLFIALVTLIPIILSLGGGLAAFSFLKDVVETPLAGFPTAGPVASPTPPYLLAFGGSGTGPGLLNDARSIAVDGDGNVYLADYVGGRLQKFDSNGNFVALWNINPDIYSNSLAVDNQGILYVLQGSAISRFETATGNPLSPIALDSFAESVWVTVQGDLLVTYDDRLVRLDSKGSVQQTIDLEAAANGNDFVQGVTDGLGNIYVLGQTLVPAAGFNDVVFKFSADGSYQSQFGSSGDEPGQFRAPNGLGVDGQGRLFVSDIHGISIFGGDGRYIGVIEVEGVAFGLTFNNLGQLLVTNREQVFKLLVTQ